MKAPLVSLDTSKASKASSVLPVGPKTAAAEPALTVAMNALYYMCESSFNALLSNLAATAGYTEGLISETYLMEVMVQASDLVENVNLHKTLSKARGDRIEPGVSKSEFVDLIFMC